MAVLRVRGRRLLWMLGAAMLLTVLYYVSSNTLLDVRDRVLLRRLVSDAVREGRSLQDSPGHIACQRPVLPMDSPDMLRFFRSVDPLQCDQEPDWVTVRGSEATVRKEAKAQHGGDIECAYTEVLRGDDDSSVKEGTTNSSRDIFVFTRSDFYSVRCKAADGSTWSSVLAGIRRDVLPSPANPWDAVPSDGMGMSVLMLGLDSLSHNTFVRTLPKTYKYLTDVLGADVLDGYNIVGDGTAQALIPMLTGKTELELPETRYRVGSAAQYVDVYPFLWGDFAGASYVTMYAEDQPQSGTFNYRLRGFKEPPTHHYARPYYLRFQQELSSHSNLCVRARPRHQVFLDYIYDFLWSYRTRPVFGFTIHGELSHDDVNLVSVADDDLTAFLRRLKEGGLLENTLLGVYSDHGHRFQSVRSTLQGKQEERLPFVSFVVPEKMKTKYAAAYQNFRANSQRLTTPFDIYATLRDVLHYSGAKLASTQHRAISLFSQVPTARSCSDAFIEPHWCACLTWEPLPVTGERVRGAAAALVHYINSHTAHHRGLCQELRLDSITWAAILLPNTGLLKFQQNADLDGFVPNLGANTVVTEEVYEVHVVTSPGRAQYEAALTYSVRQDTFSVRLSDISRTNKIGQQSRCLLAQEPALDHYCVCRDE